MLNQINHVMQNEDISRRGNLHMHRKHHSPRPVIVDHQIVEPQHSLIFIFHNDIFYPVYKFLLGRLSEKRAYGILHSANPRPYDKQRDQYSTPAVNVHLSKKSQYRSQKYHKSGNAVADAVL